MSECRFQLFCCVVAWLCVFWNSPVLSYSQRVEASRSLDQLLSEKQEELEQKGRDLELARREKEDISRRLIESVADELIQLLLHLSASGLCLHRASEQAPILRREILHVFPFLVHGTNIPWENGHRSKIIWNIGPMVGPKISG